MKHANNVDNSSDYQKGYIDGITDSMTDTNVHAFFAGVGYGKSEANVTHLGFNSAEERESFERGMAKKDDHFNAYRSERRLTWLDNILGRKTAKPKRLKSKTRVKPKKKQKKVVKMKSMGFKKEYRHNDRRYRLKGAKNVKGGTYRAKKYKGKR